MTTIIRATDASDLLALVPALAGFVAERSIVCVAFRGRRSAGVLGTTCRGAHGIGRRSSPPSSEPSVGCPVSTPWCRSPTPTPRSPRLTACPSAVSSPCWCVAPPRRDSTSATRSVVPPTAGVAARPRRSGVGASARGDRRELGCEAVAGRGSPVRIAPPRPVGFRPSMRRPPMRSKRSSRRSPTSSGASRSSSGSTTPPTRSPSSRGCSSASRQSCLLCGWPGSCTWPTGPPSATP